MRAPVGDNTAPEMVSNAKNASAGGDGGVGAAAAALMSAAMQALRTPRFLRVKSMFLAAAVDGVLERTDP